MRPRPRLLFDIAVILGLTILTQLGGIAWLMARFTRWPLAVFVVSYAGLAIGAAQIASAFGRQALSCWDNGPLQVQSWFYCAANRVYVTAPLEDVLQDAAAAMDQRYPGTITLVLDGSFPLIDGFPLLPHLSHDDGEKADLAFYYRDESGYLPRVTRSPIGYFAFEAGPTACPDVWPTLRWDLDALQPVFPAHTLDEGRLKALMTILAADARVGRILLEPHLVARLGLTSANIRFQGCRAARHDDHIHLQLIGR
ncbi:MAG: hypothetical protein AAF577_16450 [Pseudomonadota bacterium]